MSECPDKEYYCTFSGRRGFFLGFFPNKRQEWKCPLRLATGHLTVPKMSEVLRNQDVVIVDDVSVVTAVVFIVAVVLVVVVLALKC